MQDEKTLVEGAEVLRDFVKAGTLKPHTLKTTARAGLQESKIALEMLVREGFSI